MTVRSIDRQLREWAQRRDDAQDLAIRALREALTADDEIDRLLEQRALERDPDRMT